MISLAGYLSLIGPTVVYGLDTDEAYEQVLSEQPETFSFDGQSIGTHVVQDLVDIMWRPSGVQVDRDGLAMSGRGRCVDYPLTRPRATFAARRWA